jgi:hypothetical protein
MHTSAGARNAVVKLIPGGDGELAHLSDRDLLAKTRELVGKSNQVFAALLAHLAEVDARGLHRTRACASLYTYCIYELRFSEDAAARRAGAAKLVKRFPLLLDVIADGELHLTGLHLDAMRLLVACLEKQKRAATERPRRTSSKSAASKRSSAGVSPVAVPTEVEIGGCRKARKLVATRRLRRSDARRGAQRASRISSTLRGSERQETSRAGPWVVPATRRRGTRAPPAQTRSAARSRSRLPCAPVGAPAYANVGIRGQRTRPLVPHPSAD